MYKLGYIVGVDKFWLSLFHFYLWKNKTNLASYVLVKYITKTFWQAMCIVIKNKKDQKNSEEINTSINHKKNI